MSFYVYEHRTESGRLFYVGKGSGSRANSRKSRNSYWHNTVNKYGIVVKIVANDLDEELAMLAEIELIDASKKRGCRLVNLTNGGEGTSGYKFSEEYCKKISKQRTGRVMPEGFGAKVSERQKGIKKSAEVGLAISKAKKGIPFSEETKRNWKPWNHSNETKEILRIRSTGRKMTPEAKWKISLSKIGKKRISFECIYCKKMISAGNFTRWHGENCKNKPTLEEK
jgi:hypothetical protein